ncbi:exodeoxyribonuclease V subunit gamma [Candidatus Profftia tarda]|uniref:RecBCD enzyme subunit RecC n=1 Tax=Candidatus Profftia tarda TaxID=1177216 RepID=A0A8E4EY71_9ENTR|nr:exodeoxyribonuclease V subunit gamma [Candidatus Profftia tarda]CAD6508999.1 Exodeoxyribonuclease V gamma chain [Candidatus Profftia tarda]
MFIVYHSNTFYMLKHIIAELMESQSLQNPLEQEVILLQCHGIAEWVQIELAKQLGIAANIKFSSPSTFIWNLFTILIPGLPKDNVFNKDVMTWKLMWLLSAKLDHEAFGLLENYIANDTDNRKHYQLASCLADLYKQYLVYRPEWINLWEQGILIDGLDESQRWQALLWVALKENTTNLTHPALHIANLYKKCKSILEHATECPLGLPKRIFIYGIISLPPIYLDILKALGNHIDVHLMFNNPCRHNWHDIKDDGCLDKTQNSKIYYNIKQPNTIAISKNYQRLYDPFKAGRSQERINPLLASWGMLGSDYINLLSQCDLKEVYAFVELTQDNLLTRIQRDILELENHSKVTNSSEEINNSIGKRLLNIGDRSISINLCHTPHHEIEMLHNRLLDLFNEDLSLVPDDVIVIAADLDIYRPFIQAIFGNTSCQNYIPFSISDCKISQENPVIQTFLMLLDLPNSRFTSQNVWSLLELPSLAEHYGFNKEDLDFLHHWINDSGIRWGLNNNNILRLSLPIIGQNTWQFGLTRMLLGYAMDSDAGDWNGVLPYNESSGLIAELVGKLADFLMKLDQWSVRLSTEYTLQEWQPVCREIINDFFVQNTKTKVIHNFIDQKWRNIISHGMQAEYPRVIEISILRDKLVSSLDKQNIRQCFLSGYVNFCTLKSMTSIPFKVVCLLGANDSAFKDTTVPMSFDLIARHPACGDINSRSYNRYLFLEALLSAQKYFYISYISRSIQDNSLRNPSIMVSELIEYIAQSHYIAGDESMDLDCSAERVTEYLQIKHELNSFKTGSYLKTSERQSYNSDWLRDVSAIGETSKYFGLPLPPETLSVITLDELIRFYRHPVRAFFQMRLGVNFSLELNKLSDEEPFVVDYINNYTINSQILNRLINDGDINTLFRKFSSAGVLPYGVFSHIYFAKQAQEMLDLAVKVKQYLQPNRSIEIDSIISGIQITGSLDHIQDSGLVRYRPAVLGIIDGMTLWIEHLFYSLSGGKGESHFFGRKNSAWHFPPLSLKDAEKELLPLLIGYCNGRSSPLLLLPRASWAWLKACFDKHTNAVNWDHEIQVKAQMKFLCSWQGDYRMTGDRSDPYIQRVMPTLDNEQICYLQKLSEQYYSPLARNNLAS